MKLPELFVNRMKQMLDIDEYNEFVNSLETPRFSGIRVNTLKCTVDEFQKNCAHTGEWTSGTADKLANQADDSFELTPIPWCKTGFYFESNQRPAKSPLYHAGLFYIQEPSAMLPGSVALARPGERILDICAAPGGKSTQLAAEMCSEGLLVSNDINSDRVKALVKNIEMMGIRNAIVTCATPDQLSRAFPCFFDKILVDAPCSGEGMFRKDENAARSWESYKNERCADMQREILTQVDRMLKPGGKIIYSTCTFAPMENEQMIYEFMCTHTDYEIMPISYVQDNCGGIQGGRPEWVHPSDNEGVNPTDVAQTARIWPHRARGEGHFTAVLQKKADSQDTQSNSFATRRPSKTSHGARTARLKGENLEVFTSFIDEVFNVEKNYFDDLFMLGQGLYSLPASSGGIPDLHGIKVAKSGWYLGEFKNGRFIPSHSLALAMPAETCKKIISFSRGDERLQRYLKGETVFADQSSNFKGFVVFAVEGYPLGWGKIAGGVVKNLYPKGWREMR